MNKYYHTALYFMCFCVFLFFSCRKADIDNDKSTHSVIDNALAENFFTDIFVQVHKIATEESLLYKSNESKSYDVCIDSVWITGSGYPKTLTLDFGSNDENICSDGQTRKGKIIVYYSGSYIEEHTTLTIHLENYFVNDISIEGTLTIVNMGRNSEGNILFNVVISDGILILEKSNIFWSSKWMQEWINGESSSLIPFSFVDDVFTITGKANGRNRKGNTFSSIITTPLLLELNCEWMVSGKEEIKPNNLSTRFVDYGNGDCDNKIVATINWKGYDLEIP